MGVGLFVFIMIVCGAIAGAMVTVLGPRHEVVVIPVDQDGYMIENGVRYGDGD